MAEAPGPEPFLMRREFCTEHNCFLNRSHVVLDLGRSIMIINAKKSSQIKIASRVNWNGQTPHGGCMISSASAAVLIRIRIDPSSKCRYPRMKVT